MLASAVDSVGVGLVLVFGVGIHVAFGVGVSAVVGVGVGWRWCWFGVVFLCVGAGAVGGAGVVPVHVLVRAMVGHVGRAPYAHNKQIYIRMCICVS